MFDEFCDDNHLRNYQNHYDQAFDMYKKSRSDHLIAGMRADGTLLLIPSAYGVVWILKRNWISKVITATVVESCGFLQGVFIKNEGGSILEDDAARSRRFGPLRNFYQK